MGRQIAGFACLGLGVFIGLWLMGLMMDENLLKWCRNLPYGLGLPVWVGLWALMCGSPFFLGAKGMFLIQDKQS